MSEALSPFSPTLPTWQTVWDSTSLGWYKMCPRLYKYQMIDGWEPRHRGLHLMFGGLYAAALERYAHAKASGSSHDAATLRMVRWALENSGTRHHDPDCPASAPPYDGTCTCGMNVFVPWSDPEHPDSNTKNRYTLIRSLVWNAEERLGSPFTTLILANGRPAVELSFKFEMYDIGGETVALSGHMDEVVEAEGDLWVRDDKTTKNVLNAAYFQQYTPNNQMSLYSVAGKVILSRPVRGVLVKAAQIGVNFTRFRTGQVPRPQAVLDEWLRDTEFYIRQARANAEANHWPLNDKSCFLCSFKKICAVSPSHREAHLREDYVKRQWNPNQARGDI